jgi:ATP-binding cassette subfamily B protein
MHGGFERGMGIGRTWASRSDAPKVDLKKVPLKRVWNLFWPYRFLLLIVLVLVLTGAALDLVPPLLIRTIIDKALPGGNQKLLGEMVALMVAIPALGGLVAVVQNHLNVRTGQSIMRDVRLSLFHNLQQQSMAFFTHVRAGEIIARLTGDVFAIQDTVTRTIVSAVTQIVTVVATMAVLFALDWRLALLALVILPVFVLPVRAVARIRRRLRGETQKAQAEMSVHLGEVFGVSGAMLTKIFGQEDYQEERFTRQNERVMDLEVRGNLVGRWFMMMVGLLGPLGSALIYLYGGFGVLHGRLTLGDVVAFAAYLGRLYGPVAGLLNLGVDLSTALAVFQRIFEYQDLQPDVVEAPNAVELTEVKGQVALHHVSFAYRPGHEALHDVSFEVDPGHMVALVGPSGAGKSTLIQLVTRLYDPSSGQIEIDGHDLKQIALQTLRPYVAVVTQDPFLFHATVRENLLFARPGATQAELEEACRKAYVHDLIVSLPEGYETVVGERGYRFSGGERQRLAIARAILRNPRILILDEATSHLDTQSEAYVQAALEQLMRDRTTLVIAHRLSTVLAADKIVVLENGQVAESGTHADLLERAGLYAKLYRTQFARLPEDGATGK